MPEGMTPPGVVLAGHAEPQIIASGLAPTNPRESAIFTTLAAGNYTAVVVSGDHTSGIGVIQVYKVNQ